MTYDDYSQPGKLVTLKTKAVISMIQPNELALFYVYDDGPGKIVYSYEQMQFDFARSEIRWTSGTVKKEVTVSHIVSNEAASDGRHIVFDNASGDHRDKHTLIISADRFWLKKEEIDSSGKSIVRDEYRFARTST